MNNFMPIPQFEGDEKEIPVVNTIPAPSSRAEELLWNLLAESTKAVENETEKREFLSWLKLEVGFTQEEINNFTEKNLLPA